MWAQTLGAQVGVPGYGIGSLLDHWRKGQEATTRQVFCSDTVSLEARATATFSAAVTRSEEAGENPRIDAELLIQATIVISGDKTNEGQLIQAVAIPWFEIIREIHRDRSFLLQLPWRKLGELIAGAYSRAGWRQVILTPRSGDRGRDVIATKPGIGSIRIIDQVKAYALGHRVSAEEVRALLGVLDLDPNVSKGIITTTSSFAPGIFKEAGRFIPYRLELKNGEELREWLIGLMGYGVASP